MCSSSGVHTRAPIHTSKNHGEPRAGQGSPIGLSCPTDAGERLSLVDHEHVRHGRQQGRGARLWPADRWIHACSAGTPPSRRNVCGCPQGRGQSVIDAQATPASWPVKSEAGGVCCAIVGSAEQGPVTRRIHRLLSGLAASGAYRNPCTAGPSHMHGRAQQAACRRGWSSSWQASIRMSGRNLYGVLGVKGISSWRPYSCLATSQLRGVTIEASSRRYSDNRYVMDLGERSVHASSLIFR
jgi:hypothetical protein